MTAEQGERNNFVGFVPHRLEVEDRPELSDFPQNILFVNFFNSNGVDVIASALYEPDLDTLSQKEEGRELVYRNIYEPEDKVRIVKSEHGWFGEKEIKGEPVLSAVGPEWRGFFAHLTMNGLSKGERCKFERLEDLLPDS